MTSFQDRINGWPTFAATSWLLSALMDVRREFLGLISQLALIDFLLSPEKSKVMPEGVAKCNIRQCLAPRLDAHKIPKFMQNTSIYCMKRSRVATKKQ